MRILVTAATSFEIGSYLKDNEEAEILITGVGIPAALYHLQKKIIQNRFDLVIQAGIAGSFGGIGLGEVVLVKQDTFADIGMEEKENFTTVFQAGFADKDAAPFSDGWLVNPLSFLEHSSLQAVQAITVNRVSDSKLQATQFVKLFSPDIESMEGAALHYVCLQENIPFVQIRSVSNLVGERDKSKWKMKEAIINLNNELVELIRLLQH